MASIIEPPGQCINLKRREREKRETAIIPDMFSALFI
jgi:hypothetical protein